jgi:hypothetical protein
MFQGIQKLANVRNEYANSFGHKNIIVLYEYSYYLLFFIIYCYTHDNLYKL